MKISANPARSMVGIALLSGIGIAGAIAASSLSLQTHRNLDAGMRDEAYVTMKYRAYARAARAHGETELAKIFEETALVEEGHFNREAEAFGLDAGALANLAESVAGEHLASTKMYATYAEQAEAAHDHEAAKLFRRLALDEDDHYQVFMSALARVTARAHPDSGKETQHE